MHSQEDKLPVEDGSQECQGTQGYSKAVTQFMCVSQCDHFPEASCAWQEARQHSPPFFCGWKCGRCWNIPGTLYQRACDTAPPREHMALSSCSAALGNQNRRRNSRRRRSLHFRQKPCPHPCFPLTSLFACLCVFFFSSCVQSHSPIHRS